MDKTEAMQITTEEKTLIEHYRKSSEHDRTRLLRLAGEAAEACARLAAKRLTSQKF